MMRCLVFTLLIIVVNGSTLLAEGHKQLLIVASTTQIADFARQVVGDRCKVHSILAPGTDPHVYQPTPKDVGLVSKADLCLQNGMHLEGKNWMETLAKDAQKRVVTCTEGVTALSLDEDGHKVQDPHAWFSPKNAAIYVKNILAAVTSIDVEGAEEYRWRAELYLVQLRTLDGWIRRRFVPIPRNKRILVTSHDAFNYFANEYGFKNEAPVGWSTGGELGGGMTPARRKKVVSSIRGFGVPAIFVETSVNPRLMREIAKESGVIIGGELYSDSMGEVGSSGETYIGMMRENVVTIISALSERKK